MADNSLSYISRRLSSTIYTKFGEITLVFPTEFLSFFTKKYP